MVISKEEKLRLNREYLDRKLLEASEGYKSRNFFVNSLRSKVRKYQNDGKAGLVRARKSAAIPEFKSCISCESQAVRRSQTIQKMEAKSLLPYRTHELSRQKGTFSNKRHSLVGLS